MKITLSKKAKRFWKFFLGGVALLFLNKFTAEACFGDGPFSFFGKETAYIVFYANLILVLAAFILALIYMPTSKKE